MLSAHQRLTESRRELACWHAKPRSKHHKPGLQIANTPTGLFHEAATGKPILSHDQVVPTKSRTTHCWPTLVLRNLSKI
jgi:hypothetical protein